ncbi:hypothetical protein CDL12_16047 [Handroanthus impetiginosus]|uniref:Pentatricopeptide repeat-containing protein n=1 Tax=Handroanthus impetiginosus TaxID=429701 RepID=A0A2G9H1G4_9LAMI|nr:hypothetical protein CDL12_16047 [Handroanthus impetiginosus]
MQLAAILSRTKAPRLASTSLLAKLLFFSKSLCGIEASIPVSQPPLPLSINNTFPATLGCARTYHDGRPRGPLWRGKKLIGKQALFVILGLKRFRDDDEELDKFIKTHGVRLLEMDMVAVLNELQSQEVIRKQDWYKPDVYLYKDLIVALARCKRMDGVMELWEDMRKENLFPDSQKYTVGVGGGGIPPLGGTFIAGTQ